MTREDPASQVQALIRTFVQYSNYSSYAFSTKHSTNLWRHLYETQVRNWYVTQERKNSEVCPKLRRHCHSLSSCLHIKNS